MQINDLTLPDQMLDDGRTGRFQLNADEVGRLAEMLTYETKAEPKLFDLDHLERINAFLKNPALVESYLGTRSDVYFPGDIDPARSVVIGEAAENSPIILDYRSDPARVVYLANVGNEAYWIALAPSYGVFIYRIKGC